MKNKTFLTILFLILALCALLTIAHFIYAIYAYDRASIIYFVGKEWW